MKETPIRMNKQQRHRVPSLENWDGGLNKYIHVHVHVYIVSSVPYAGLTLTEYEDVDIKKVGERGE